MQAYNDKKRKQRKADIQQYRGTIPLPNPLCLPAPKFWDTKGDTALPMDTKINEKTFSTRMVAAYPASAWVPKGFTTACTIIIPTETVDCCSTDGTAMRSMVLNSCRSKRRKLP